MNLFKVGYTSNSSVKILSQPEFKDNYASPEIIERLEKFASTIQTIAPRSDDFLYFTIIFLKAAEAALIDEFGNHKKVGNEKAWGYFDDNWAWHGNVKPHKNSNSDIFPELELKKAARNWIGRPLCVDHKSDSVDGVRGIILDTYYDEKLKQVVGLCALDKINYPDLARNVQTGVIRYGSMGTAVATSICTECGQRATNPQSYCNHIIKREAWGEINVGLNPIEYSLVVQPAEPGAILLRCIASIRNHENELKSHGLSVDELVKNLDEKTASDLDLLLNSVCGKDGCSLEQRKRIIAGYLNTNGFTKSANYKKADYNREILGDLARFEDVVGVKLTENPDLYRRFFGDALDIAEGLEPASVEKMTTEQDATGSQTITNKDNYDVSDLTGTGSSGLTSGVSEPNPNSFQTDGVGPEHYAFSEEKINLKKITGEIMNEARLRKRANWRRSIAFHPADSMTPVEPNTYTDEGAQQNKIREQDDKQMNLNPANLGGTDGMVPGDKEVKDKVLRAKQNPRGKIAFHPADSMTPVEPNTYTSEDYHKYWDSDKHMHQTKSMGGDNGMFPGDDSIKEHQKRARYEGPALSTKFKQRRGLDGVINKAASCLEIYSGDKLIIAATAGDIFGPKLEENWEWITSKEYAKMVVAEIRNNGVDYVGKLFTRKAQELPPLPEEGAPVGGEEPLAELPAEGPTDMPELGEEADQSPKTVIEDALVAMESTIDEVRSALADLGGGEDVDVNVNLGQETPELPEDKIALSKEVFNQLKTVLGEAKDSADELAMLSDIYDRYSKLSASQKRDLATFSRDALNDFSTITGQSKSLVSMAKVVAKSLVKTSEYKETPERKPASKTPAASSKSGGNELVSKALELRRQKRESMLKKAEEMTAGESYADDEAMESCAEDGKEEEKEEGAEKENKAHDGIGMKENAPVANVTSDTAEDIANKKPVGGEHKPGPHKGNQDAKQFDSYPSTPSKDVAEKSVTSVKENKADDMSDVHELVEDEVAEEVDKECDKENDAKDQKEKETSPVQEKLASSFMKKKQEEEKENYRVKLRRAYNVAMEMQRKGMIASTRSALDTQVDNIMEFDDRAFEAFKNSIANFSGSQTKIASSLEGINIGITEEPEASNSHASNEPLAVKLANLWKK